MLVSELHVLVNEVLVRRPLMGSINVFVGEFRGDEIHVQREIGNGVIGTAENGYVDGAGLREVKDGRKRELSS